MFSYVLTERLLVTDTDRHRVGMCRAIIASGAVVKFVNERLLFRSHRQHAVLQAIATDVAVSWYVCLCVWNMMFPRKTADTVHHLTHNATRAGGVNIGDGIVVCETLAYVS